MSATDSTPPKASTANAVASNAVVQPRQYHCGWCHGIGIVEGDECFYNCAMCGGTGIRIISHIRDINRPNHGLNVQGQRAGADCESTSTDQNS